MIIWFSNQAITVQTAVIALLGVLATALVNLANSSVNALSKAKDRGHERKMKQLDKILDKRLASADALIDKMNEFYQMAFDDYDWLKAVASDFADELRGVPYDFIKTEPIPVIDSDAKAIFEADARTRAKLRTEHVRKGVRKHHYDIFASLRYNTSYWAWSPNAKRLQADIRSLSTWFNNFYGQIVEQADALEVLLRDAPNAPGLDNDNQARKQFIEKLDEFWQGLEYTQSANEEALKENMLMIQSRAIKLLD